MYCTQENRKRFTLKQEGRVGSRMATGLPPPGILIEFHLRMSNDLASRKVPRTFSLTLPLRSLLIRHGSEHLNIEYQTAIEQKLFSHCVQIGPYSPTEIKHVLPQATFPSRWQNPREFVARSVFGRNGKSRASSVTQVSSPFPTQVQSKWQEHCVIPLSAAFCSFFISSIRRALHWFLTAKKQLHWCLCHRQLHWRDHLSPNLAKSCQCYVNTAIRETWCVQVEKHTFLQFTQLIIPSPHPVNWGAELFSLA